jgi:aspartyl-tRNA(Asn)/glutamyl-tRNA(Gln) amidotransferase subunit A
MANIPSDPLEPGGIAAYGQRLRAGAITAEAATEAYLARIDALDPKLEAFQHLMADKALETARAMDALLAAGTDLGPLMGVPVAIKDLFAIEGTPVTAGSLLDLVELIGPEGSFVQALKAAGCVIIGKTKTVEFAFGTLGTSKPQGTPWNPWDAQDRRIPGGSSSGSAVAVAAGLCGFAIGSDTGGSVRLPATFCGTFGLKTTVGLWPTDGVFPLCTALDTIGPLTRSAADAAIVYGELMGEAAPVACSPRTMRLGKPVNYFYDNLDEHVAKCMNAALAALEKAGVEIVPVEVPDANAREEFFPVVLPVDGLASIGRDTFLAERDKIDPIVATRLNNGLEVKADDYVNRVRRRERLCQVAAEQLAGLDGWITPTIPIVAAKVSDFDDPKEGMRLTLAITQATQPGNYFGLCATTTPIQAYGSELPVAIQLLCPAFTEERALSMALAIEELVGVPPKPDLSAFL